MKKGFTLIELMVVVVIIGILAAVAVPKYFGMIAKSKASEVTNAAGAYIEAQDAYYTANNYLGNFAMIGYSMTGKVFTYTDALDGETADKATISAAANTTPIWSAKANVDLGDCKEKVSASTPWSILDKASTTTDNSLTHTVTFPSTECQGITSDMIKLNTSGS